MRAKDFEIDLGDGHWASFFSVGPGRRTDGSEIPRVDRAGVIITHRQPRSATGWCQGAAPFEGTGAERPGHGWKVASLDPLTMSPSILCRAQLPQPDGSTAGCDDHGFIEGGRWRRA